MNGNTMYREHLMNLLNALTNLSPSRNILSQFILMTPNDFQVLECSYPELMSKDGMSILLLLGIEINGTVSRSRGGFAEVLFKQIHEVFEWLDDEEIRSRLAKLLDIPLSSMPNPYAEWVECVLQKLSQKSYGPIVIKLLNALVQRGRFLPENEWEYFLEEFKRKTKADPFDLEKALKVVIGNRDCKKIGDTTFSSTWVSIRDIEYLCLEHGVYHLDVICVHERERITYGHGYTGPERSSTYEVKHKKTIENILRRVIT